MNTVNPFRSKEDNVIYYREYYKANKDKLDEYYINKEWRRMMRIEKNHWNIKIL